MPAAEWTPWPSLQSVPSMEGPRMDLSAIGPPPPTVGPLPPMLDSKGAARAVHGAERQGGSPKGVSNYDGHYEEAIKMWKTGSVFSAAGSGVPATSEHDSSEPELISVRMLVDKPPEIVGPAVMQSLMDMRPGEYHDAEKNLEMPWPVGPEWAPYAKMPPQFQAERVFKGGQEWESWSFSMGLRPLCTGEHINQCKTEDGLGFDVLLRSGAHSWISAFQRKGCPYTFDIKVWSNQLDEALKECRDRLTEAPYIACTCRVRKAADGKHSELIRSVLCEGPVVECAKFCEGATVAWGVINFMLEMEARAWLAYRNFPLIEVWRGLRRSSPHYVMPVLNVIQSYALGSGHAAASAAEQADGPCYHVEMAKKLSAKLPNCPQGANNRTGREYTEGNVNVESFAALLDRVCRRAAPSADIFRKFVDLGSGRGHAVLAAHALFPFRACIGCELVPDVVNAAKASARRYAESGMAFYALSKVDPAHLFLQGDFFQDLDWSDASIVFANALTFPKHLIKELGQQALRLRPGAVFIIAVKTLKQDDQEVWEGFDMRGEAVLMGFMKHACRLWAYQRR